MNYQVLARKYRPQNFQEIVGQEHVVQALVNGLENNRLHHAFLFTGTRGVGKTTIARVLAKALNCLEGVSGNPCGVCQHCQEIKNGEFIDLIEVDAASRTGVDDTRSLLENVQYSPNKGQYKIYLIDEVHMFSKSSFNALLKTLEEPPEHVKFLLATTEPDKLPVTVLSRCLQFNLKRLTQKQIGDHLVSLLQRESVAYDDKAIQLIARVADGSMRDSLSLLDQSLAFGAGQIKYDEIRSMLGTIEQSHVTELLQLISAQDHSGTVDKMEWLNDMSVDYTQLLEDLCLLLHEISLVQTLGRVAGGAQFDMVDVKNFAKELQAESIQWYYQLVIKALADIKYTPSKKISFEMAIIRMLTFVNSSGAVGTQAVNNTNQQTQTTAQNGNHSAQTAHGKATNTAKTTDTSIAKPSTKPGTAAVNQVSETVDHVSGVVDDKVDATPAAEKTQQIVSHDLAALTAENWPVTFQKMQLRGLARELARNLELLENTGNVITFAVDEANGNFMTDKTKKAVEDELLAGSDLYSIKFVMKNQANTIARMAAQEQAKKQDNSDNLDPVVAGLQHQFGAQIIQNKLGD
ncbi:DNA polymerase III subunit gamma/tau [Marinicella sp. S1101]|uniref:DNA polymerase III subunit gamma/tau n=1 Tax=Marinicella marina TaxID=2996016 RepID=UPI002260B19E|nr:DNA polymerase III subunit gamma/tau [Marinicella marina]MCX7554992.1 DNA polymerase III subunit gamma/tau [Marinicella marina]MDJ1141344.1 DNA polymerase III subunit gamma/tau [Marinicella marina]